MPADTITIQVNAEPQTVQSGETIAGLLKQLEKNPQYLAVEQNRILIRRAEHAQTILQAGDIIEIVTLVGGG